MRQHAPERQALGLALPHRPFDAEQEDVERLLPLIREYDASVWHMQQYVPERLNGGVVKIVPPAIDPLSPKNMALSPDDAAFVCEQFGIDPSAR